MLETAGRFPLDVGTRGTVGSLVKREIEYFRRIELGRAESSVCGEEMDAGGRRTSWLSFRFLIVSWRKKKRRNSGIRPGMCSTVEVAENLEGMNEIYGISYRNLKADSKRFEV